jgi:hypothetical protein
MARDRRKTIASLRRLAARPGTPEEGETARRLLEKMSAAPMWAVKPFLAGEFPRGTSVFYNYWAYRGNESCQIIGKEPKLIDGKTWIRMKFDRLKQPRWVPVTSAMGCHISRTPLSAQESEYMCRTGWLED